MPVGLNAMVLRSAGQCQVRMAAHERITGGSLGAIPTLQEKSRAVRDAQALIEFKGVRLRERSNHDQWLRGAIEKCLVRYSSHECASHGVRPRKRLYRIVRPGHSRPTS